MSSAALANGAGVTAGSTVALFQSIGAAGLSAKAMTALGAGGAVIGSGTAATFTSTWDYAGKRGPQVAPTGPRAPTAIFRDWDLLHGHSDDDCW